MSTGTVFVEINDKGRIEITSGYGEKDLIRQVPGARWDKHTTKWHTGLSWSACKQLRGIFKERLEIGPQLMAWAQNEMTTRVAPANQLRLATEVADADGLVEGLYNFQMVGAQFLITAQKAILGDPVGSGKTIQTLAAARSINALPALVVTVNSMKRTWEKEIEKWWPGTHVIVLDGGTAKSVKSLSQLGCGKLGICELHNVTLIGNTMRLGSADLAMKKILENAIQTLQNGSTKTLLTGITEDVKASLSLSDMSHQNNVTWLGPCDDILSLLKTMTESWPNKGELALSALLKSQGEKIGSTYTLTTIIIRVLSEDFSVLHVILAWDKEMRLVQIGLTEPKCTCPIVIVNWESVRNLSRLAGYGSMALTDKEKEPKILNKIPWKLVVADEGHKMKDPKSKCTRAMWAIGDGLN